MGRRIITQSSEPEPFGMLEAARPQESIDKYTDKLIKYIPADIIGAWLAVRGLILSAADLPDDNRVLWVSFGIGIILTFLWTIRQTNVPGKKPAITQSVISTVAFVIWVMAMGEPFELSTVYGSLLLILFSLVVPLVNPPEH